MCSRLLILCFTALSIQQSFAQPAYYIFNDQLKTINDIEQSGNQHLWLATDSGVVYVNTVTQTATFHLPINTSANQRFVRVKMQGNTLWAASEYDGLWKFQASTWTNLNQVSGLASNTIYDFDISANGRLWIATASGISEYDGSNFTTHAPFSYNYIPAICTMGDTVYAGNATAAEPIKKYTKGNWKNMPNIPSLGNNTRSLKVSSDGVLHCTSTIGSYSLFSMGWQNTFTGLNRSLSKNGPSTKLVSYENIGMYVNSNWDTLKNPFQFFLSSGIITSISSFTDSSFWCGYDVENKTILAHYFVTDKNKSFEKLNSNSLNAGFSSDGFFFQNSCDLDALHSLTGQGKSIAYMASPQLSAWQGSSQNRISTKREYTNEGLPAMVIGPISSNRNSAAFFKKYNRVWRLSKAQIETHKSNFASSGYTAPESIISWPGNGNQQHGEEKYVAPFIDQNYNGIYEPMLGDYPDIRGDEAAYFVYNSAQGFSPFGHQNLNIEFHTMAYVFDSVGTPAHNTLFINQKLIFKNQDFDTLLYGMFIDFDLGNHLDDVVGCDSTRSLVYVYNGDDIDEGSRGWGTKPPAAGFLPLNYWLKGFIAYNGQPGPTPTDIYHFRKLERKWQDGTPLRIDNPSGFNSPLNGSGYLPGSHLPPTNWQFNDAVNWYFASGVSLADQRSTGIYELTNIQAGDEICLDYAFLYAGDSSYVDATSSINELKYYSIWIKDFFSSQFYNCADNTIGLTEDVTLEKDKFILFPNPNNGRFTVFLSGSSPQKSELKVLNTMGQVVFEKELAKDGNHDIVLNVANGMYLCVLTTGGRIVKSEKIVIQK